MALEGLAAAGELNLGLGAQRGDLGVGAQLRSKHGGERVGFEAGQVGELEVPQRSASSGSSEMRSI
jgi:hypothetical protein